jgi:two-component system, cell cycle sensor histidine kinase and response regulator CckA
VLVALERLRSDPFAFRLVVSDQTMPVMTGVEFARRIHEFRSDLPVVLASGHSVAIAPERIQAAGVCEILSKPYTVEMLAAAVSRNLPRPPLGNPE